MHVGRSFGFIEALVWTRRDILKFIIIATIPTVLFNVFGFTWLALPWVPVALIGTAVAFLIGFKNNATYDRLWEARKIWGGIINASRTWAMMVLDFVNNTHAKSPLDKEALAALHKTLMYQHIAWITCLRYQLRKPKSWETMGNAQNREYRKVFVVLEEDEKIEEALSAFLKPDEIQHILSKKNPATHMLAMQGRVLSKLMEDGLIEDFRHMEMENMLKEFYDLQGKSERIKNFPYPRQFATLNLYFVWIFLLLIPFGMLQEFAKMGGLLVWLTIPFSTLVSWVFHTMEKIGEATENPFQGGANDIPITNISRTIEIDLREMLGETNLPDPIEPVNKILM